MACLYICRPAKGRDHRKWRSEREAVEALVIGTIICGEGPISTYLTTTNWALPFPHIP